VQVLFVSADTAIADNFIHFCSFNSFLNNQNFLVKEMLEVNDETQSVIATLTNHKGEEVFFTGGFSQWFEGLIQ
jgi:hypothetical protein